MQAELNDEENDDFEDDFEKEVVEAPNRVRMNQLMKKNINLIKKAPIGGRPVEGLAEHSLVGEGEESKASS